GHAATCRIYRLPRACGLPGHGRPVPGFPPAQARPPAYHAVRERYVQNSLRRSPLSGRLSYQSLENDRRHGVFHLVGFARGVYDATTFWFDRGDGQESIPPPQVNGERFLLETIRHIAGAPASGGSPQTLLRIDIEDERQIRHHAVHGNALDALHHRRIKPPRNPLIDPRGIYEPVAKDN